MIKINYNSRWSGYENFRDPTNMPMTALAAGSLNTFIPDGDKLEPRAGMTYLGATGTQGSQTNPYWTLAHRIHSKYDEFVTKQGTKIPLRIFYSGVSIKGDIIEAYVPVGGVVPPGGVLPSTPKVWLPITATTGLNVPSAANIIISTHRYFWAEWFDSEIIPPPGFLQPELIFTFGGTRIGNWSGGFANIVTVTPTTLVTDALWTAKGFIAAPEGTNIITVNGREYVVTAGFGTNTVTVASTVGIIAGDVAFQSVYFNDTLLGNTTYDVCSAINNQVYYQDWKQRNVYISWNRNQVQFLDPTIYIGSSGLNDALFAGPFTGTKTDTYKVTIDSVPVNFQEYTASGFNGLNNANYLTTGYSGSNGVTNIYKVLVVADLTLAIDNLTYVAGAPPNNSGVFSVGEVVTGSASNATGTIVRIFPNAQPGIDALAISILTGSFSVLDTILGNTSQTTATLAIDGVSSQDWISYFKNDVLTTITSGTMFPITGTIVPISTTISTTLTDGLLIKWGNHFANEVGDVFKLTIRNPQRDTFSWVKNGETGSGQSLVTITGGTQALSQGVTVNFEKLIGHDLGDSWSTTAFRTIIRGWSQFYYTLPVRYPGEGFTILLDSNGWTMKPQEKSMLVNAQAGHFYNITTQLSADLLSESVQVDRLKSEPQNKILFPYLINYIKNQLATISQDKTFDVLGRQKFLELQQSKTLSDAVRIDFETSDWTDADILYFKRKIFFCLPKEGLIFIWDDYKKYWQPPQSFGKRISLLSVIDDKLVGHSYEINESYELFKGLNDLGLFSIKVKMVLPYDSSGLRYSEKSFSAIGFEGYILGLPKIKYTINSGLGGCDGQVTGEIKPVMCLPADDASLGKSSLGFHGLGNHPADVIPHFFYIKPFNSMLYYQRNIEIEADLFDSRFSLVSLGTDLDLAGINNVSITDKN